MQMPRWVPKSVSTLPVDQFALSTAGSFIRTTLRRASLASSAGVADRAAIRPVLRRNRK
jgi:hypothetical protein